jgi:hypothetical protein
MIPIPPRTASVRRTIGPRPLRRTGCRALCRSSFRRDLRLRPISYVGSRETTATLPATRAANCASESSRSM